MTRISQLNGIGAQRTLLIKNFGSIPSKDYLKDRFMKFSSSFNPAQALEMATMYHREGRLQEAEMLYRQVLQRQPTHADALHLLGVIAAQADKNEQAILLINKAIKVNPTVADYYTHLGNALQAVGRLEEAVINHQKALQLAPHHPTVFNVYNSLGVCLYKQEKLAEAIECYEKSLELNPNKAVTHFNLGNVLADQNKIEDAITYYRKAIAIDPYFYKAYVRLGHVLRVSNQIEAAILVCQQALQLNPNAAEAYVDWGAALLEQQQFSEALEKLQQALAIEPNNVNAYFTLGNLSYESRQWDQAIRYYQQVLTLKPNHVDAHNNLAVIFGQQGKLAEAIEHYHQVFKIKPHYSDIFFNFINLLISNGHLREAISQLDRMILTEPDSPYANYRKGFLSLILGDFVPGWRGYSWRAPRQEYYTIRNQPLPTEVTLLPEDLTRKRIALYAEQGLGDELFFLRFAPILKARGAWIAYQRGRQCGEKLVGILKRLSCLDYLISDDEKWLFFIDYSLPIGDLPAALGMSRREHIPPPLPLTVLPEKLEEMSQYLATLGPPPYFGLTWRAGTRFSEQTVEKKIYQKLYKEPDKMPGSLFKEISLEKLAQTLNPINATFLVLQRRPESGEVETLAHLLQRPLHDLSHINEEDLDNMLALIYLLDDYVGVSNTNMHLMAGLGKTARVLTPFPPDYRWMIEGDESPWFKGFKVYRQTIGGDWSTALEQLTNDLRIKYS